MSLAVHAERVCRRNHVVAGDNAYERPDGKGTQCRACNHAQAKARYQALTSADKLDRADELKRWRLETGRTTRTVERTPASERSARSRRLIRYGLTVDEYDDLLTAQNGVCAICGGEPGARRHHVDHDHVTGKIRGLLCTNCNQGIGRLKDDPNVVLAAAMYLLRGED